MLWFRPQRRGDEDMPSIADRNGADDVASGDRFAQDSDQVACS